MLKISSPLLVFTQGFVAIVSLPQLTLCPAMSIYVPFIKESFHFITYIASISANLPALLGGGYMCKAKL